jgi:hypothetical protein
MSNNKYKSIITTFESAEVPLFIEQLNKGIVFFGINNLYPYELIDLYNDSSTHNAIINGKVGYTVGNGMITEDAVSQKWLDTANLDEDWTNILKRISLDYELFNGYAIEVVRTSAGKLYNHIDFANCRVGLDGTIKYAIDWIDDKRRKNSKPHITDLPRYNPTDEDQKRSIIYHTDYRPNFKYYPLPVYVGSLAEIKTDVNIGDYWLNQVENGFIAGTLVIHKNGVPETPEEKLDFEETFGKKFAGPKGQTIAHIFAPSGENASEVVNLNGNDLHERYGEMSKRVKESIFIGHRVTNPILFGVKEAGQLGGRSELDLAYEIFNNTYIQERRNTLLSTINKLCFIDTGRQEIEIEPLKPVDTFELTSDVIIANLKQNEIRDLINEKTGLELQEEVNSVPLNPDAPVVEGGQPIADPDAEQKDASYNGAQIASALSIVEQVKNGVLSSSQGKAFLMEFLRLSENAALALLREDETPPTVGMCSHFEGQDEVSKLFEKIGEIKSKFEIVKTKDINFDSDGTPMEFAVGISELGGFILASIFNNPLITALGLSELFKVSLDIIGVEIDILKSENLLDIDGDTLDLTAKGERTAEEEEVPDAIIMYSYELRTPVIPLKAGGKSRDFCSRMMAMDKVYSREEIDFLRNNMKNDGYSDSTDVWLSRGGWYKEPNNQKAAVPFCRHIWKQQIVRRK